MNDPRISALATLTIGTRVEGGFFAGYMNSADGPYGLAVPPKAIRIIRGVWGKRGVDVPGARSFFDGRANTLAMAEAGSVIAQQVLALESDGCKDFAIAARDEAEVIYRAFKPTTQQNYVWRSGDNPSSLPVGYPYTEDSPAQTAAVDFQAGGSEAYEPELVWTSTQFSAGSAWSQYFGGGHQSSNVKYNEFLALAVRRFKA